MSEISRIRQAVRSSHYEFSQHALEEMDADELDEADIKQTLLRGGVRQELIDDPRGIRYLVKGKSKGVDIEVICRFLPSGWLRIITVYVP